MAPTPEQVEPRMAGFLTMLDDAFRRYGLPGGLPNSIRRAVAATPRHMFVHRFRQISGPEQGTEDAEAVHDSDIDPMRDLAVVYSDAVMMHVDTAGQPLPSTNSQPSYVLWLLHLLGLEPGHRVLEIGSGSGWLAAIMGRLIGESGHVTGIEVIPELAAQSRADLDRLGIANVTVLAADGGQGHSAGAPYDRVMITAATWDLPTMLFDQVADGGRVLVPVELRGGGCQVAVLRRAEDRFVCEQAIPGWFVPLLGPGQQRPRLRFALETLPFWREIAGSQPQCLPLPLATVPEAAAGSAVIAFRAFLGRVAPGFAIFGSGEPPDERSWASAEPFGIVDEADRSVAVWRGGELLGYGGTSALRALARAYSNWTGFGMPGLAGLGLEVVRAGAPPVAEGRVWTELRVETALIWYALPGASDWRRLLDVYD